MSATDELRRLLDERGVEWVNTRNDRSESDYFTEWQFDGIKGHAIATEWVVGHLTVCIEHPMSPEQAIAATLGDVDLAAENAKLRELLSEIAKLVTNSYGGCLRPGCAHGCPHYLECDEELHTCFYVDRMRELGVVA